MFFNRLPNRCERLNVFKEINEKYKSIETGVLAKSILSSEIHYYKIGCGRRNIISVGAHHGMEHITSAVLYNIIEKMGDFLTRDRAAYGTNIPFLLQKFTFWFIPCLNPDGVDISLFEKPPSPLCERILQMNGGENLKLWQANARGVDLNHNYDFRFAEYKIIETENGILPGRTRFSGEDPESEAETRALANLVRVIAPDLILSFHTQGEEVYVRPRGSEKASRIGKICAKILEYELSLPTGLADYGGLSDYAGEILGLTSLTVELGKGENPLPYSLLQSIFERVFKLDCLMPNYL